MRMFENHVLQWLERWPSHLFTFCLGGLVGLLLKLPVFPYVLPEGAATIISAALGAVAAVGGALWLQTATERRQVLSTRKQVAAHILNSTAILAGIASDFEAQSEESIQDLLTKMNSSLLAVEKRTESISGWVSSGLVTDLRAVHAIQTFAIMIEVLTTRIDQLRKTAFGNNRELELKQREAMSKRLRLIIKTAEEQQRKLSSPDDR